MAGKDFHKVIVGRAEFVDFVDFDLHVIPAKVDTGAFRSAVHADNISLSEDSTTLTFRLLGGHPVCEGKSAVISTKKFATVRVSSSFGHHEERFSVKLRVTVGPETFWAEFSLANRSKMVYPVLLGRKVLSGRFLVDTAHSQIDSSTLKERYGLDSFSV